jgi:tRNA(fMet)-specific endonuclease VapC
MKLMLDTNICIYVIKQRPERVIERFRSLAIGDVGISIITLAELQYGAGKSSQPKRNHDALQQFVSPLRVADFDRRASAAYGEIRPKLEHKGHPIGAMDLLIAAHALSLGVPLVTSNVKEFKHVPGLVVENWAA